MFIFDVDIEPVFPESSHAKQTHYRKGKTGNIY